jgi:hypothetical protein
MHVLGEDYQMQENRSRTIPLQSVSFGDPESSAAARDHVYLDELARQAEIATQNIAEAWKRGLQVPNPRDPVTWSLLQAALFAAIVIARILRPRGVRKYPTLTQAESREYADSRGSRLRELLEVDEDSPLFDVEDVRHAFEHVDERLDAKLAAGVYSLSDWYITDGYAAVTPEQPLEAGGVGLRIFFPAGGILIFGHNEVDLYELDYALLQLRNQARSARDRLRTVGRGRFGGQQMVQLMSPDMVRHRCRKWLRMRTEMGVPLDVALEFPSKASDEESPEK